MVNTLAAMDEAVRNQSAILSFIDKAHDTCIMRSINQLEQLNISAEQAELAFRAYAVQNMNSCPNNTTRAEYESQRFLAGSKAELFTHNKGSVITSYTTIICAVDKVIMEVSSDLGINPSLELNAKWILSVVCMFISQKASEIQLEDIIKDFN